MRVTSGCATLVVHRSSSLARGVVHVPIAADIWLFYVLLLMAHAVREPSHLAPGVLKVCDTAEDIAPLYLRYAGRNMWGPLLTEFSARRR